MLRYTIGLSVLLTMVGVLYHFGPSQRQRIRFLSPGGLFVVIGWLITGFALRFYFSHSTSYSKTYGTVAGMVIMLMVFYLDAIIILVGAELNHEIVKARYEDPKPEPSL
ncbi:MAG: YihY/virulence factor BrkB family protein [Tepidisphaeraceae bacterium]